MNTTVKLAVAGLKQALPGLQKVISRQNTLPVLACVRVTANPDGPVLLRATNLDDFVTCALPSQPPAESFDGLLPLGPLLKIIKGYGPQEILTFCLDQNELSVLHPASSSHLREKLEFLPLGEFPAFPASPASGETVPVGDEFKEALRCAFACASEESTRRILGSAYIDVSDPEAHYIVGADGHRLFTANSFHLGFKESLIIPHRKFLLWPGFLEDGAWRVGMIPPPKINERGHVLVQSNRWTLITVQIEGTYPHWRQVLPGPGSEKTRVVFNDEAMRFICLAAPKLPGDNHHHPGIEGIATEGGSFLLRGKDRDHEASVPVTGAVVTGEPVRFCLNRQYLLQALKLGLNELEIVSPLEPLLFCSGGRRFLVAPMRPDASGPAPAPETASTPQPSQTSPVPETTDSSPEQEFNPVEEPKEEMNTIAPVNRIAEAAQTAAQSTTSALASAPLSAFAQVREQIEKIKETLKTVVSDLHETARLLGQVQKEKKTAEKEIEGIRDTLRTLQQVRI